MTLTENQGSIKLLIFSYRTVFQSSNSSLIQKLLVDIINKGYDKPRYKYNVIKSSRIKHSLEQDLGIENQAEFMICLCVHTDKQWMNYKNSKTGYKLIKPEDIEVEHIDILDYFEVEELKDRVIGSIALKPYKDDNDMSLCMEITALTSFYPKMGKCLIEKIESYYVPLGKINKLYAHVIVNHDLVQFYEKLGFIVIGTSNIEVDPVTGLLVNGDKLEDDILASQDFQLAKMYKEYRH
ncbi:hypothetical protein PACTADRAFT_185977 [Pachysolen tannophilus NRRL Y-2460]|uniref:N-acetyltransferase domain-containing protein n=1 Tax=Pachysolen tannophilus NRRL Y-2460 TaxID=669874 RepID=A0A1E4U144_PACTA|nr:hypothetical protein PACTADRAFT_185977 [Pachysolen tannophilus NRRL Y-2460]